MSREDSILYHTNKLFLQNGYEQTTMRQIADVASVSLGLATYHYKTKRTLAVTILAKYLHYLKKMLAGELPPSADPLVRSAAMVHLCMDFFMAEPRRLFFCQCLARDIYMEAIQSLGNEAMNQIAQAHHLDASADILLLYDNYIPPAVEKILILEKEKGNFPNISYEDIPAIVFSISVDHYVAKDMIEKAVEQGCIYAHAVMEKIAPDFAETLFMMGNDA